VYINGKIKEIGDSMDKRIREQRIERLMRLTQKKNKSSISFKIALWDYTIKSVIMFKKFLDVVASLILIILLSPVFIITALFIYIEDPGPVFYIAPRVGKDGKHFGFIKFRSMVMNADKIKDQLLDKNESKAGVIFKMKKDPRVTKTGRFIRRFSIDELPQLFNVLKGDMSLVGPRPPLPREVAEYTLLDRKRLHVMPGITCLWQVKGRSDIPFDEQVQLDMQYIKSSSFWKDIKILIMTIPAVISGKGAY
jgi:lipopolysaccharide/colanic/teichoic acid biosynthesis glycosyltransferase